MLLLFSLSTRSPSVLLLLSVVLPIFVDLLQSVSQSVSFSFVYGVKMKSLRK